MKKISLTFCLALLSSLFCPAQVSPLQFNKNGEFKIVQFTDIHFKYGNPASDIALKRIGEVLDAVAPRFSSLYRRCGLCRTCRYGHAQGAFLCYGP